MFKIGEFAQMGQVSVRTLRHYDELGLLKPLEIDRFSGYRYYSTSQLPRLNRILALKDLGLSLEEIGQMLDTDLPSEQLKGMIRLKQAEFRRQLYETQNVLVRLDAWLNHLEKGGSEMSSILSDYEITVKKVEPILVASIRQTVPAYGYLRGPFEELRSYLAQFGWSKQKSKAGPSLVLWHFPNTADTTEEDRGFEVEVAEQLEQSVPGNERIKVYPLPGLELAASVTHRGELDLAYQAYQALGTWVEAQGYKVCGPTRQIHHEFDPRHAPVTYVTELQLPIEKLP